MTRQTEAAFAAFAGLDPIRNERETERLERHGIAAESTVAADIARIVALPRRDVVSDRAALRGRQASAAAHGGRSRSGALGLVLSAAVAVAATLLWVSPSAGAPSRPAHTPPIGIDQVAATILPLP